MLSVKIFLLFGLHLIFQAESAKIAKNWALCTNKSEPECLKKSIQNALTDLNKGNLGFGILSMDPLRFEKLTIDQETGPVAIKLDLNDLDLKGIKNIKILNAETDWKNLNFDFLIPKVTLVGKYKIDGKILILPIQGDGDCNLVLDNFNATAMLKLSDKKVGNQRFYRIDDFRLSFVVSNVKIRFDNLFKGDQVLGNNMNAFLNENGLDVIKELKPAISRSFSAGFREIGNRIFSKIEINEINPN